MKARIVFKKERELGTILSDTFKFLRIEGKELFGYILRIAAPALFILIIAFVVVKKDFWSLIGLNILAALIAGGGFALCFFPGVYWAVCLSSVYSIFIFDKLDVSSAISYSFKLIKGEWWITFATLFVVFLLYYVMIVIFQIPQWIYFFIKQFVLADIINADPSQMFDWIYIALNALGMIGQYLGHTLVTVATIFVYFNLNEKKNLSGTIERIEAIGGSLE